MSGRAQGWAWDQRGLSTGAKLLLMKLAESSNDDGITWPSKRTLAADLCTTDRTIKRWRSELEEAGLISIRVRRRQNGSQTSNVYQLHLPWVEGDTGVPEGVSGVSRGGGTRLSPPDSLPKAEDLDPSRRKEPPAARARTARDEIWDALTAACGIDSSTLTSGEKSRVGRSVNELVSVGATPLEIQARAVRYRQKYEGAALTDRALVNHWSELHGRRATATGAPEQPCPECELLMSPAKLVEHRYSVHQVGRACPECGDIYEGEHKCKIAK